MAIVENNRTLIPNPKYTHSWLEQTWGRHVPTWLVKKLNFYAKKHSTHNTDKKNKLTMDGYLVQESQTHTQIYLKRVSPN